MALGLVPESGCQDRSTLHRAQAVASSGFQIGEVRAAAAGQIAALQMTKVYSVRGLDVPIFLQAFHVTAAPRAGSTNAPGVMIAHKAAHGLIADHATGAIHWMRVATLLIALRRGARDKQAAGLMQAIAPLEVELAAVHYIVGSRLSQQQIEHLDVVRLAPYSPECCKNKRAAQGTSSEQACPLPRRCN